MHHVARKRFGQHFLTDRVMIESIIDADGVIDRTILAHEPPENLQGIIVNARDVCNSYQSIGDVEYIDLSDLARTYQRGRQEFISRLCSNTITDVIIRARDE